jgi:hypothetical protein
LPTLERLEIATCSLKTLRLPPRSVGPQVRQAATPAPRLPLHAALERKHGSSRGPGPTPSRTSSQSIEHLDQLRGRRVAALARADLVSCIQLLGGASLS